MLQDAAAPAAAGTVTDTYNATQDMNIIDAPAPRPDQLPMGSSRNTWPNIVNNKVPLLNVCVGVGVCVVCFCVYICGARTVPELHGWGEKRLGGAKGVQHCCRL
eukprot:CAMPEP_0179422822 /NCGR_PEP_ID=MMETSP0799-20121207/10660_1 /TAXON_ID=46947 /ORGANISM="Geminigera cryophila, Strain CCMP2564" /LENGTH=103 /DNA_ID=CAMNT_0021197033 /DNA_START=67 /DNA_END=378 /DNA_ORIENTATION=+